MFKFNGLKSLPSDVRVIHFVVCIFLNKIDYGFYIDTFSSGEKYHISKSQFIKFHNEVEDDNFVAFTDRVFVYNDKC